MNETVVGGIADLCIGGRAIVSVGLYSDVTGGAKQEIVPKKAVFTGFHREVTMEKQEAHELDEKFTDRDNSITNLSKLIANESTTIANTETKLVNDMRQMEERLTQLINDRIAVVNEDIATTNGSVRAQKTRVDAVETSVGTVQNDVRAVENRVEEASARVDGAETANCHDPELHIAGRSRFGGRPAHRSGLISMKVIKDLEHGLLLNQFGPSTTGSTSSVTIMTFFAFANPDEAISEQKLWPFIREELGKETVFDGGMPKPKGEVLIWGRCFAAGREGRPLRHR